MQNPIFQYQSWNLALLELYVADKRRESLELDYKAPDHPNTSEDKKRENVSKDVSALANSAGGALIYGITEDADNKQLPGAIVGVDPETMSETRLEDIITSNIRPRIGRFKISTITVAKTPRRVVYVIEVPQSFTAHMARDNRYYKRYNFKSVPMEDYEVRDVMNRATTPDLVGEFIFPTGRKIQVQYLMSAPSTTPEPIELLFAIRNRAQEPAFYIIADICIDTRLTLLRQPTNVRHAGEVKITVGEQEGQANLFHCHWGPPGKLPIWKGNRFLMIDDGFQIGLSGAVSPLDVKEYLLSYTLSAPHMQRRGMDYKMILYADVLAIEEVGGVQFVDDPPE